MPAPAATGLSGLYTVEFHKPPDEGPAPQPSWDASRSSGGIQPSKEKMRRVLYEEDAEARAHAPDVKIATKHK